ncbi:MAG: class I SAM-dependent methyltransferase [Chloroflexota bacterium]
MWFIILLSIAIIFTVGYWLIISTEGVFLGSRLVIWLYDFTAHRYDEIKEFDPEWEKFFVARPLLYKLRAIPAPRVLDVATGTGRVPALLLEQPTFHGKVFGVDASSRMLQLAAQKLSEFPYRTSLIQQSAAGLPFPAQTFDAVTCLESLEFFPSDKMALQEMVRVLKPGGILMVTRRRGWEGKLFISRYKNVAQFEQMLTAFGLEEVNTQPWQFSYDQVYGRKPL